MAKPWPARTFSRTERSSFRFSGRAEETVIWPDTSELIE
jgi:hypothetical protein